MRVFFDLVLFDRQSIMQMPVLKKVHSYFYVISLVLVTSLLVVGLKTTSLDIEQLTGNIGQMDNISELDNIRLYQDGLNTFSIENDTIVINGNEIMRASSLRNQFKLNEITDIQLFLTNNKSRISFVFFIYEYLISFKYLILFILLLTGVAFTAKYQLKSTHEITFSKTLTYTSYILTIPILISAVLRLLNFRFSNTVMILVILNIVLMFLFTKNYMTTNK